MSDTVYPLACGWLKVRLVAIVVSEDSDRSPYVPPPGRTEHPVSCLCHACLIARQGRLRL